MRNSLLAVLALAALAVTSNTSRADFIFEFGDSSGNGANLGTTNYTVNQGATFTVGIYLLQTNTGSNTNGLTTLGLNTGGVQLSVGNSSVASITGITANDTPGGSSTKFDSALTATDVPNGILTVAYSNPNTGLKGTSVFLGDFTFTGGAPGTTSTITAVPYQPGNNVNILAAPSGSTSGTVIDSLISNSSATITVTAVPEPGSPILCSLAAAGAGLAAWRRRRKQAAA